MAVSSRKFQAPKGTRDFYPQDMAVRRYIESVWRTVSINHGFDEIEGPTFEHLDLYTHKSGPGIASELFQVFSGKDEAERAAVQRTAQAPFALRPEFTPTLARMVAAQADSLPKPIKWFAIPSHFRAERPQRGRLREFLQWNVDFIGDPFPYVDAEVISTAVAALRTLGLCHRDVRVRISHRNTISKLLNLCGVLPEQTDEAFGLLDRRGRTQDREFQSEAAKIGFNIRTFDSFAKHLAEHFVAGDINIALSRGAAMNILGDELPGEIPKREVVDLFDLKLLWNELNVRGLDEWCEFDVSIVRGLAYYTGTVFEIHEATGAERAIAGGGRYDNLIESFGGPALPACGFGMGDVVLSLVLHDKGLLPEDVYLEPLRPHAFVIAADDNAAAQLPKIVADLRKQGFHIRHSYKTTRNVGKLLSEASKARARSAIILGKELAENRVAIKNLESGEQREIPLNELSTALRTEL